MLQNLTNFFNLITNRKIKTTLKDNDLIAVGTRDSTWAGNYQPTAITYEDLEAQIAAGVTPVTPNLQAVVNTGNSITNFGGIGNASISSINFVNNRSLYLNNNANPTIRIVDNLNAANNLQIDIDTLTLDGVSYNWSSIVTGGSVLPPWIETNATDLTIWNNGKGNIASNTSYGSEALKTNTVGTDNTSIGTQALKDNTTGNRNTALGTGALAVTNASDNTAVGANALSVNTGTGNTAVGATALRYNTSGNGNTAIGQSAMSTGTSGYVSVAIGQSALSFCTGGLNVGVGVNSLQLNTGGSNNVGVGFGALNNNTTGQNNTALGGGAMPANTIGFDNVAIGASALLGNTTGTNNVAIGTSADSGNFSGSIILGKNAQANGNNQFVVGSSSVPAGTVTNAAAAQSHYWTVKINGTNYKILLST
jgi:hypothetical protein